jgi:hypothetical protein
MPFAALVTIMISNMGYLPEIESAVKPGNA